MYVIVLLNSDGFFDPKYNDVIGPFYSEADAKARAPKGEFSIEELAMPEKPGSLEEELSLARSYAKAVLEYAKSGADREELLRIINDPRPGDLELAFRIDSPRLDRVLARAKRRDGDE
jgi:hypothetical protein